MSTPDDLDPYPRCVLLRVGRDDDARILVTTGLAWRGGPRTRIRLTSWLIEHVEVPLSACYNMPDAVRAYVTAARS